MADLLYHGLSGEETKITQKCEKKVTGRPIQPASGSKGTWSSFSPWLSVGLPLKNCFRVVGCMLKSLRLGHVIKHGLFTGCKCLNIPIDGASHQLCWLRWIRPFSFPGWFAKGFFLDEFCGQIFSMIPVNILICCGKYWGVMWGLLWLESNRTEDFAPPFCEAFRGSLLSRHFYTQQWWWMVVKEK